MVIGCGELIGKAMDQPAGSVVVKGTECLWPAAWPSRGPRHVRKYRSTESNRNEFLFVKSYKMILYKNKVCRELWLNNTNDRDRSEKSELPKKGPPYWTRW